jgi:hypothetical protein
VRCDTENYATIAGQKSKSERQHGRQSAVNAKSRRKATVMAKLNAKSDGQSWPVSHRMAEDEMLMLACVYYSHTRRKISTQLEQP